MVTLAQTTPQAIKQDENFLCGLELNKFRFYVYLVYTGSERVQYYAFLRDKPLFHGDDFKPSPLRNQDDIETLIDLLGFLTCKPGDTDDEYFSDYNRDQLAWANSYACEELSGLVSDFEDRSGDYHKSAKSFFKKAFIR